MRNITQGSPPEQKIQLFRQLFKGREDVYARRFESVRTGKSGYQPVCANEWKRGHCDKRATACARCPNRQFLPLTDAAIRQHLMGVDELGKPCVIGVYPLLVDETCNFLAMDFDKSSWREDVAAVLRAAHERGIALAVERSRSGNGAHLWAFLEQPMSARLVRQAGFALLTAASDSHAHLSLDSYDRLFPNQDTMHRGGFGNLIALPLQKAARAQGNSIFLDDDLEPLDDQWAYLAQLSRVSISQIESLQTDARNQQWGALGVRAATDDEEFTSPRTRMRLPEIKELAGAPASVRIVLKDRVYVEMRELPSRLLNRLVRLAAFQNPEFFTAQSLRLSTHGIPRIIACGEFVADYVALPRGCLDDVSATLRDVGASIEVEDERNMGAPLKLRFEGELRREQQLAAEKMLKHDTGVLSATTAFGKTVLAAWMIAQRGVNTLVLVNRRQLQSQWVARLASFLGLEEKAIGRFGGGHKKLTGVLDVALFQSLVRKGEVKADVARYGHVVVDECHAVAAASFEAVLRRVTARYVLGLSATPVRKDGHHPILFMQCGQIRHRVSAKQQAVLRPFAHLVMVRPTTFQASLDAMEIDEPRLRFARYVEELVVDERRNRKICQDVALAIREGRSPVVLSERRAHLDLLATMLSDMLPAETVVLEFRGGYGRRKLAALQDALLNVPRESPRLILATGRFLGEGFDDPRLDTLFITLPVSWRGVIAQYAGRLHRMDPGKSEVRIYDYADLNVAMLASMFDRRCRGYEAIGYRLLLPPGATEGWPPGAELPIDPQWHETYSATVRRLLRDGVDEPLANLFLFATKMITNEMQGTERARSAVEAFLYQRLQTLDETAGLFVLNGHLPIPFGDRATMEVDLLCECRRLAVEVDGAQHLGDAVAYRRDRMKDLLLQEHGYLVIRFLADDVVSRLDRVLDGILRMLRHRSS